MTKQIEILLDLDFPDTVKESGKKFNPPFVGETSSVKSEFQEFLIDTDHTLYEANVVRKTLITPSFKKQENDNSYSGVEYKDVHWIEDDFRTEELERAQQKSSFSGNLEFFVFLAAPNNKHWRLDYSAQSIHGKVSKIVFKKLAVFDVDPCLVNSKWSWKYWFIASIIFVHKTLQSVQRWF